MMALVYLLQFPNGKGYVGKTTDLIRRLRGHRSDARRGSKTAVAGAIRCYGDEGFTIIVLHRGLSEQTAFELETAMIALLMTDTRERGYNLTKGGDGVVDPTGEIGKKISRAKHGKPLSSPHKQALSEAASRRCQDRAERQRMATIRSGKPHSSATRKQMVESQRRRREQERA